MATLEQQIYSIEAANINKETLMAMDNAQKAMAQIHDNLDITKVDETMYVPSPDREAGGGADISTGKSFENNMLWARKSHRLSQVLKWANLLMNRNWMTS